MPGGVRGRVPDGCQEVMLTPRVNDIKMICPKISVHVGSNWCKIGLTEKMMCVDGVKLTIFWSSMGQRHGSDLYVKFWEYLRKSNFTPTAPFFPTGFNYEYIFKTSILISGEGSQILNKKSLKNFHRSIFDRKKNLHIMIVRTHWKIWFLNPHDDHKSSYLENLTLGSLLKNRFLTRYGYISTRNGHLWYILVRLSRNNKIILVRMSK